MEGYGTSTYGDRFAEVYDAWYGEVSDVAACTVRLAALAAEAGGGPVLELGVGSGRIALPLAALGVEVHGIDASAAMLDALRAKPGGDAIRITEGDMAALELVDPPAFSIVFVAFNTFFNLPTPDAQLRCLRRAAERLAPNGLVVIEAFVAQESAASGGALAVRHLTADEVVLTVSQHDRGQQTITGQHIHVTEGGIKLRPWHLRYADPAELDTMAASAGLELAWRHAGWTGTPFHDDADAHVSAYRRTSVRDVRTSGSSSQ